MGWRELVAEKQGVTQGDEQPVETPVVAGGWRDLVKAKQSTALSPHQQPQEGVTPFQGGIPAFPEEREETRAAKELPELGQFMETGEIRPQSLLYGEDKAKVLSVVPALMTTNPEETAKILQENFPNIGISYDPGGNILASNNKTGVQNILNRPGMSQRDMLQFLGITAAFTPSAKVSGLLLQTGAKVGSKMLAGGAAAATTQAGIEAVQEQAGGEFNKGEVALAGGLGAFAEVLGPAYRAFKETRVAKGLDVARSELAETIKRLKPGKEAVLAIEKLTGVKVGLFQGQQTMLPSTLTKQRLMPQLDAGSRIALNELEKQNKSVFDATIELVNKVAGPEVVETGAKRFREAANSAINVARQKRTDAVSPLYKGAFEEAKRLGKEVDLSTVTKFVNKELENLVADDPAAKALKSFLARLKGTKIKGAEAGKIVGVTGEPLTKAGKDTVKPLSLEQLQSAKFTTDAAIEKSGGLALNSAQKNAKRLLSKAEKLYVDQLGKMSAKFKAANDEFAKLSPAVKEVEDSFIGKAAKTKDINLDSIGSKIFSSNSNPFVVSKSKKIIDAVDPGAWDDLMRIEFQKRIGSMDDLVKDIPSEMTGNIPGLLRSAIFGSKTSNKRKTLLAALSSEQRKNFVYLDEVLYRASSGRQAGSPTAANQQVIEKMKGTAVVLREYIFKPREVFLKSGERKIFDRNVAKLTDILFDPKWTPRLKQLRSLDSKLRGLNGNHTKSEKILRELFDSAKASTQTIGEE